MQIIDLHTANKKQLEDAAIILVEAFKIHWQNAWPDLTSARKEVREALEAEKIALGMVDDDGSLLGWAGAIPQYSETTWELHPLAVHPAWQSSGIGTSLLQAVEIKLRGKHAVTVYLGTDDEDGMTSLSQVDLYSDIPGAIAGIRNLKDHPYSFYLKNGYTITGVIPDANGPGKPDIIMAKRL